MKIKYHDKRAVRLNDLKVGEFAIGAEDRNHGKVFARLFVKVKQEVMQPIVELTDPLNQYHDMLDMSQLVRRLEKGESLELFPNQ